MNDSGFIVDAEHVDMNEMLTSDPSDISCSSNAVFVPGHWGGFEVQIGKDVLVAMVEAAPEKWFDE